MSQRIAVLGSGANGSAIGADLTVAGLDVMLVDQWRFPRRGRTPRPGRFPT